MLNIDEVNKRRPRCNRCGCLGDLAWVTDKSKRQELYQIYVKSGFIRFVKEIRKETGCKLNEAKATAMHLASQGAICHRCGKKLSMSSISDCPKCKSLNIIWE